MSQRSVATRLRCGGILIFNRHFIANLYTADCDSGFWKSVNIRHIYDKNLDG